MSKLQHTFSWNVYSKLKKDQQPCKNVFYYTSTDTFKKIIENGCIFASHIKYMNDWQEFDNGYECISHKIIERLEFYLKDSKLEDVDKSNIQDIIQFFKQEPPNGYQCTVWTDQKKDIYEFGRKFQFYDYAFPQVYNISFTSERDLLNQWKMYARESGIAIEFDFNKNNMFSQKVQDNFLFKEKRFPKKVIYQDSTILDEIELTGLDDEVVNSDDIISNLEKIPYIKSKYYSVEEEYRLIFRPYTYDLGDAVSEYKESDVRFRESNHVLIPYLEIYCLDDDGKEIGWPIVSLTIGPGHNQDVVYSSVIYFVENISQNIYNFTVNEYIDNFERYYTILISKLKKEIWRTKNITIKNIIKDFRKSVNENVRISEYYSKGKFKSAIWNAEDSINQILQRELKEVKEEERGLQVIEQFKKDHYLSSNGIIIQKSKAPYIFN